MRSIVDFLRGVVENGRVRRRRGGGGGGGVDLDLFRMVSITFYSCPPLVADKDDFCEKAYPLKAHDLKR